MPASESQGGEGHQGTFQCVTQRCHRTSSQVVDEPVSYNRHGVAGVRVGVREALNGARRIHVFNPGAYAAFGDEEEDAPHLTPLGHGIGQNLL